MKKLIKNILLSLLLMYPCTICCQLITALLMVTTGLVAGSYAISCIIFGTLTALPVLSVISKSKGVTKAGKWGWGITTVLLAGITMLLPFLLIR